MNRSWNDFKSLYGNMAGAREAFEEACETLFRKKHTGLHVSQVQIKQGDGGIDIFIGELGIEPITVIQCKFFLETFDESQKSQIRESFSTSINSDKYELKEWILCIPRVIDIDENSWWFKWKHKKLNEYSKPKDFIKLTNGNELIDLLKEHALYNQVFKIEDSLKLDEIHKAIIPKKFEVAKIGIKSSDVLFNNYSKKCEPYYLERNQDCEFNQSLEINNLWIFGKSGVGKTALINRNLLQKNIEYCFCDLSPISITCADDVLNEMLSTIEEKFDIERDPRETNKIKQIAKVLSKAGHKKVVIVIDELGVNENSVLTSIASNLVQLVTYFSNYSERDELKFVVSTISNPNTIINNRSKASDYFQFISCDTWSEYSLQLFDVLNITLDIKMDDYRQHIINISEDSPRVIKAIFRKIIALKEPNSTTILKAINLAVEENVA